MPESDSERDGILRMQDGIRDWVRRTARHGSHGLRAASPTVLLSVLCASAVSPVVTASAGGADAAALAGVGLVSSVGGNVLSTVITNALDRLREHGKAEPSPEDLEEGIAGQIQDVLSADGGDAQALRAEIAEVLEMVNASGIALQASIEAGDMQVRRDIIAVFGELSDNYAELRFLLDSIDRAAVQIQANQDEQGVQLRVLLDRVGWAGTEARLAREEAAAWRNRPGKTSDGRASQRPRWTGGCPYRGLLPFTEAESGVFYGRERLTANLAGRLSQLPDRAGIVIVTGASGAGKSSLLRAGLLPMLAAGLHLPGSQHWPRIVMTPAGEPLAGLAAHLAALGGGSAAAVLDDLSADPGNAHLAVRQAAIAGARRDGRQADSGDAARLVLVVDQFEQVFAPGAGRSREPGRQAFIAALCAAATRRGPQGEPPALVILAVRGDYWDQCAAYPQLARALQDSSFVVGPMTETELRLAITGPAETAGLRIEDTLTDVILSDLRSAGSAADQGVLPLLSQAMLLTWENRDGDQLTIRGYGQAGGIARAVGTSADAVYDALTAGQRTLAREALTRMTAASSDGRITRRTVSRDDLYAGHPGTGRDQIDAILEAFAARRLVVLSDGTAEISHDALLHAWPRFRGWLEEDQASLILHSQLTEDAAAWRDHGDDPSFLYRGTQLAAVRQGAARWSADPGRYPALTSIERDFLHASDRAATLASRRRRFFSAVLVLLVIASLTLAGLAVNQTGTARRQTALAVSSQLATQSEALDSGDPITASLLAAASWHFDQSNPLARESLLNAYAQPAHGILHVPGNGVSGVAFSPDDKFLATAGSDGTFQLWDAATHRQVGPPIPVPGRSGTGPYGVAFSPKGKLLATAGGDGMVRLWDAATHRQVGPPIPNSPVINGIAFSPDGKLLATAGADGAVRLWNIATHRQIGAPIPVPGGSNPLGVLGVAFSPNGKLLATAGSDGTVRLWNVATRRQVGTPISVPGSSGAHSVSGVAFSPDGKSLATAGSDGTVRLWDVAIYRQVGAPIPVPRSSSPRAFALGGGGVLGVAFSPNGKLLATAGSDGTVRLWNIATRRQAGPPIPVPRSDPISGGVLGVAFSPNGKLLATADSDGMVRLWDAATRRQAGPPISVPGSSGGVLGVAFSPNGKLLATPGGDGAVRLWDAATRRQAGPPIPVPGGSNLSGVAFSPNGKLLATAGGNGAVRLWDVVTRGEVGAPVSVPGGSDLSGVAFSPDGKFLATTGDGAVRLWDAATRRQVGAPIPVPVFGMAFSPDGKSLATAGSDGTVRLWDVAFPGNLLNAVCAIADRNLTSQEWSAYIPSKPFQKVCP